jgi:opacity protein-like surface antigen
MPTKPKRDFLVGWKGIQMDQLCQVAKATLLFLFLGIVISSSRVNAQTQSAMSTTAPEAKEADADAEWHFTIAPYIWFAGVQGTTGALGHEASVHADFSEVFNYLNIGAMGAFEARYKRVIIPVDFMWMKLSDDKGIPVNDIATSVKAKMTETMLTPKIGYRIADGKRVKVDALFGFRYWHLSTDLALQPVTLDGSFSQSTSWVDAVAGGRITAALTPKVFAVIAGDAGGGTAKSDYQVGGGMGYELNRKLSLLVGYRYLHVNYRSTGNDRFIYDVNMPGLVFGAIYKIK